MPRQWMSVRGRKRTNETHDNDEHDHDFNFMFTPVAPCLRIDSAAPACPADTDRPKTSSGISNSRPKARFAIDTGSRPRTSQGRTPPPSRPDYSPVTPKDEMIGLAFGSPTHPPAHFYTALDSLAPIVIDNHAFEQCGPFNEGHRSPKKKWKKLGGLFKARAAAKPTEPFYKLQIAPSPVVPQIQAPPKSKLSMSKQKTKSPKESELVPDVPQVAEFVPEPICKSPEPAQEPCSNHVSRPSLPKLQVEIPSANMDRYTVMFEKVAQRKRSSSLLVRRSKMFDTLTPEAALVDTVSEGRADSMTLPPTRPRRQSSPTASRRSAADSLYPLASPGLPKPTAAFSLFPNTSTTSLRTTKMSTPVRSPLKRSVTSPARMSPMQETFDIEKPPPLRVRKNSDKWVTSPEQSTASTEQSNPWSAITQLTSASTSTTIDEDILFDVKSFRDSQGGSVQFEMARPNSTAVALYRSVSHMKARAPKPSLTATISSRDSIAVAGEFQAIDETIAAVQKFTSVSPARQRRTSSRTHIAQILEGSPPSKPPSRLQDRSPLCESPEAATPLEAFEPTPPPVPAKDNKFIMPVSKFARLAGPNSKSRPSHPLRSATEPPALTSHSRGHGSPTPRKNHAPASHSDESLAVPSKRPVDKRPKPTVVVIHQPHSNHHSPPKSTRIGPTTKVPAIIQPVAEVSVARTISLSRKQSHRVLVRKSPRLGETDDEEEEKKRRSRMELLAVDARKQLRVEGDRGHRVGKSVGVLIESA